MHNRCVLPRLTCRAFATETYTFFLSLALKNQLQDARQSFKFTRATTLKGFNSVFNCKTIRNGLVSTSLCVVVTALSSNALSNEKPRALSSRQINALCFDPYAGKVDSKVVAAFDQIFNVLKAVLKSTSYCAANTPSVPRQTSSPSSVQVCKPATSNEPRKAAIFVPWK